MSARNRVFIGILLIYVLGLTFLLYRVIADLDPRYRESAEESLVETAHLIASFVEHELTGAALTPATLRPVFQSLYARRFEARIYSMDKTRVEMRVYVADRGGRVVFDSLGRSEGQDYSEWRDVKLGLEGRYGARTTLDVPNDPASAVMYVAAPIRAGGDIVGVVSVGKPVQSFGQFVDASRRKILLVGAGSVAAFVVLAVIVSVWLVRPFGLVSDYVRYVRSQRSLSVRRLGRRLLRAIGAAFEEMRDALAGRHYVSEYVQALTHEVKSPLSAIRGAAELLQEPMPEAERQRFLGNIARETQRIQELVDRMLELAALQARQRLDKVAPVDLARVAADAVQAAKPLASRRGITVTLALPPEGMSATVPGDAFLLQRATTNLLENAIDFSPQGGTVELALAVTTRTATLGVRDHGPGIPDYALDKVFEKFYSLARPDSQKKGTGLGLPFVKEIAGLHGGSITVGNAPDGGAVAQLALPRR
jgi:two-component system sensor histidine kinase CreC